MAAVLLLVACGSGDGNSASAGDGATGGPGGATSGASHGPSGGLGGGGDGGGAGEGGSGGDSDPGATSGASAGGAGGAGEGGAGDCESGPEALEGSVHQGDLLIASDADALAARAYSTINGTISVSPDFAGTLDLPSLLDVGGIRAEGSASSGELVTAQIKAIRMPNLVRVRGTLWIYLAFELREADFRKLEAVDERLWIHRNTELATLRLDALRSVGEDVQITDNFKLPACGLEMIEASLRAVGTSSMNISGGLQETGCECRLVCGQGLCL
ncbi:hypothetical protein WMF27_26890 [Sorangium sp. So ce281]|uniref:hypothetical protein n=1 Tax=unclassified Sorangium TaxID=2621164 RepID=UPI003F5E5109